jgi:hypothetical protein
VISNHPKVDDDNSILDDESNAVRNTLRCRTPLKSATLDDVEELEESK